VKGLDTNVLLRIITADDPAQAERAEEYLSRQRHHGPFWINRIVLCELIWSLTSSYKFERERVVAVIKLLLQSAEVTSEANKLVANALYLFQISDADFADCLIGLSNGLSGCESTATFDLKAAKLDEFELI
jgi:predicted nucleic-acid-binding protein